MNSFKEQLALLLKPELSCQEVQDLFSEFLDLELLSALRDKFEDHIICCPDCKVFARSYKAVIAIANDLGNAPMPDGVADRLRLALNERLGTQL